MKMNCPKIDCVLYDEYMEPNNLCLYHDQTSSSPLIKLRHCSDVPNQMCDLFGDFAWTEGTIVNETETSKIVDPRKSPLYGKRTEVKCIDRNDLLESDLNNGRRCLESY